MVQNEDIKWSYAGPNCEDWNRGVFDTLGEADKEALVYGKERGYTEVLIGRCQMLPLPVCVDSEDILNRLNEQYADEAGSDYEGDLYEGVSQEDLDWLEEELSKVVQKFHERVNIQSSWYSVLSTSVLEIK